MGALRSFAFAITAVWMLALGAAPVSARADDVTRWRPLIAEASARFGLPEAWIEKVVAAESAGQTVWRGRPITSSAGAMGLMQLMPATWATMRQRLGLGTDPHNPRDNILAGSCYLRLMYDRFGYPGLFAAYNAGPGRYGAVLAGASRLPAETQAYLLATAGQPGAVSRPPAGFKASMVMLTAGPHIAKTPAAPPDSLFFALKGDEESRHRD